MAKISLSRENFVLHKLHSLSGIVPVGYYMVQHLALNSFSIAGPGYFDNVIGFFDSMPAFALLAIEVSLIWIPLAFHAIYGLMITGRSEQNFIGTKYGWSQNRMYLLQRVSGVVLFFFLIFHVSTTTLNKYVHNSSAIKYAAMHDALTRSGYVLLIVYMIGVLCACYHLAYGIWNFCIRWGITISESAQMKVQKFSVGAFVVLTLLGWAALLGFVIPHPSAAPVQSDSGPVNAAIAPSQLLADSR